MERRPARTTVESVRFQRSPLARFGTQLVLLVVAVPIALKASGMAAHGLGTALAVLVVGAALAAPVALDLWAMVAADREGIRWRNAVLVRKLTWPQVAGFDNEPTGTVLRRATGATCRSGRSVSATWGRRSWPPSGSGSSRTCAARRSDLPTGPASCPSARCPS